MPLIAAMLMLVAARASCEIFDLWGAMEEEFGARSESFSNVGGIGATSLEQMS